jgi:hypothetical protein
MARDVNQMTALHYAFQKVCLLVGWPVPFSDRSY